MTLDNQVVKSVSFFADLIRGFLLTCALIPFLALATMFTHCMAEPEAEIRKCPEPNPCPICDTARYPDLKPPGVPK